MNRFLALSLHCLGQPAIAERFIAPAELAAITVPALPLGPGRGPVSFLLLDPRQGSVRTTQPARLQQGVDLSFGFPAFANRAGATFFLFAFQTAAAPAAPDAWRRRLAAAVLMRRPPIRLACNEAVPGFGGLVLPPHPPGAMHRLACESVGEDAEAVAGAIEASWQEGDGCYVQGWLHAYERRVLSASVLGPGRRLPIPRLKPRPDLPARYPMLPDPAPPAGFALFVPWHVAAGLEFSLETETETGPARLFLPLPARAHPPIETIIGEMAEKDRARTRFDAEINERGLEVLEIGARLLANHEETPRDRYPNARRYVGMDIHPGPMVDVVGDVHELSRLVGRASFDAVFSGAVLEHLAMPWIVAAEINRVLRPGGLTYHIAPQAWPVHEEPNDFWRFTDEALKLLFGEPFGFEVLNLGMADRTRLYPFNKEWGDLGLPFGYGYASSWVLARKVREIDEGEAASPFFLLARLGTLGRRYPLPR